MSNLDRCGLRLLAALWLTAMSVLFSLPALAAPANPILVELFTSEGCSDCPPADAFLKALDAAQPIPGAQLIVLEEHVDYWDDQGWRDPFSSHALTLRQSEYVDRLHVKNGPYTPQMVIDGSEAFVGSDRGQAGRAFAKELSIPKTNVQISALHVEGAKILAHVDIADVPSKAEVFVAVAVDHAQSQVLRCENIGRVLVLIVVVKRLSRICKMKNGKPFAIHGAIQMEHSEED